MCIRDSGTLTQDTGEIIQGSGLELLTDGSITLNEANDIETLAASLSGSGNTLQFTDSDGFSVGSVLSTDGVSTTNGAIALVATTGNITVENTAADDSDLNAGDSSLTVTGSASEAVITVNTGADVAATGGITFTSDKMNIGGTLSGGSSTVILQPETANDVDAISLGVAGDGTNNTLELSDTELDAITAGVLQIGSTTSGDITCLLYTSPSPRD